jgi:hypothetical protein
MNRSGIKRGLAATAISALAVTGVPFLATSASANPVDSQVAAVTLFSQANGQASVKNDGTDTTVRLEAGAPANITSLTFQVQIGAGTPQDIVTGVTRNDDGAFSYEWTVPALLIGADVNLIATGTTGVGPAQTDTQAVTINGAGAGTNAANVTAGATIGVFQAPAYATAQNVIVSGTTSATGGTVSIVDVDGTGADASTPASAPVTATGTFKGVLDISTGAAYTYTPGDQLVVRATNGSDDVETFGLYKQVITTVTAVAADTSVPTGGSTTVTVTVLDQNGNPVAGARVDGSPAAAPSQLTDANGKATFTQNAGVTRFYFADATNDSGYQSGNNDQRSADVAVGSFVAVPTTLAATSADGAAFDLGEYAAGDVTVQVKNQNGGNFNPADAEDVQYFWQITPFAGGAQIRVPAGTATTTAVDDEGAADAPGAGDDEGKYTIAFPAGQPSGTYELFAALEADSLGNGAIASSKVLTVKAGQAKVTYDQSNPQSAPAGGQVAVDGQLVLEDGTGLAGRTVNANFARGTVGSDPAMDAGILPAAGTTPVLSRAFTTAADGSFSLVVDDPADTPQGTEVGGKLSASVAFVAEAATQFGVDFSSAAPPAGSTVTLDTETGARPGETVTGSALVQLPDGPDVDTLPDGPVAGTTVTLTVDQGFFTDGTPDPAPVVGADAGEFKSLTQTITGTTDANGRVSYQVAIERNTGFDDDGMVKATVTATAGTATDTEDVDYTSANPVNGGSVSLELSPEAEQDGSTTPAPVGNDVAFDVYALDQFGNRVGGETVNLSEDGDDATTSAATATTDFEDDGDFTVTSTEGDDVTVTASWTTETRKYTTATGTGSPAAGANETLTDTATVEFAAFDLSAADLFLISKPGGTIKVGGAVTETLTVVDEFGDLGPSGLQVTFTRVGPGGTSDTVTRLTNANGQASYAFVGTVKGVSTITAEVTDGSQVKTVTDKVTFASAVKTIKATISGTDNGAAKDKVKVSTAPAAPGAKVTLYKVVKGKKVVVGVKTLKANGKASFGAADTNGNAKTKYYVVVAKTASTTSDRSNTLRLS